MADYERRGRGASEKTTANGTVSRARAYLAPCSTGPQAGPLLAPRCRTRAPARGGGRAHHYDPAREDPTIRGERDRVLTEEELGRLLPLLVYPARRHSEPMTGPQLRRQGQ
jgi:hypothetical protein